MKANSKLPASWNTSSDLAHELVHEFELEHEQEAEHEGVLQSSGRDGRSKWLVASLAADRAGGGARLSGRRLSHGRSIQGEGELELEGVSSKVSMSLN